VSKEGFCSCRMEPDACSQAQSQMGAGGERRRRQRGIFEARPRRGVGGCSLVFVAVVVSVLQVRRSCDQCNKCVAAIERRCC
jgi:hypothetical protein